jgi:hypothetical protein
MNSIQFRLYANLGCNIRTCQVEGKLVKAILFNLKRDIGSSEKFYEYK